jgi:F420-0:gamma-glutamyl ligase
MVVQSIKTPIFRAEQSLSQFIVNALSSSPLADGDVLAITSKIVSIAEHRVVNKASVSSKYQLVQKEADFFLGGGAYDCYLTIKHGLFIPSAGIDESNSETNDYILYPVDPFTSAYELWKQLKAHFQLKRLGIILTDSHTTPLRRGVTGISLAHAGFHGVTSKVGHQDLFGKPLQFTYINDADALASMAVYTMGEADDQKPLALVRGASKLAFTDETPTRTSLPDPRLDLYYPMFQHLLEHNN